MPKVVDREKYRKELLDKCLNLFSQRGYGNVTMREIARELGVSTGTLYHYFPDKQNILESLFGFAAEQGIGKYKTIIVGKEKIEEKIDLISNYLLENEEDFKNILLLAVDLFRNSSRWKVADIFIRFSLDYRSLISEELHLTDEQSKSFFIFLIGLLFHRILTPDHVSYRKQVSIMRGLMIDFAQNGNQSLT